MRHNAPPRRGLPAFETRGISAYLEELIPDAREQLESWPEDEQQRFHEQLEDAASELQRELLGRALAAGHDVQALHAFADALRPLSDQEAFAACTVSEGSSAGARSVVARLRAEADPLFAFESNGFLTRALEADEDDPSIVAPRRSIPASLLAPIAPPVYARAARPAFDEESRVERAPGRAAAAEPFSDRARPQESAAPSGRAYAGELYTEATRALGLSYREEAVDVARLTLEAALERVAEALGRNILVPAAIGAEPGEFRKDVLFLQVQPAGKSRSFQLHDPFGGETVWVHERDLLGRLELPFRDKRSRRITAVSLPSLR